MAKFLALDLASKTGFALFENRELVDYGYFDQISSPFSKKYPMGENHPYDLIECVKAIAKPILEYVGEIQGLTGVIIEQTNKGKNRSYQKLLEWIHFVICDSLRLKKIPISYIDTRKWRSFLGIQQDRETKKFNRALRKKQKEEKLASGKNRPESVGVIDVKDLTIYYVNKRFGLNLKAKDDDVADAICIGLAYLELR